MADISPYNYAAVSNELGLKGFRLTSQKGHAVEYSDQNGRVLYLQRSKKICLVADPESISVPILIDSIDGYETWNSNFTKFPKKKCTGKDPTKYGVGFDLVDPKKIGTFIDELRKVL